MKNFIGYLVLSVPVWFVIGMLYPPSMIIVPLTGIVILLSNIIYRPM